MTQLLDIYQLAIIIGIFTFIVSFITLYSGFGLGTVLMPFISIFFPIPIAIALTAIVHLIHNLIKLIILGKFLNVKILFHFGIPAVLASILGAWMLTQLSQYSYIYSYQIGSMNATIEPIKMVIGILLLLFATLEIVLMNYTFYVKKSWYLWAGLASGFFGGLSGHQGAFRTLVLAHSKLNKQALLGTNAMISALVDLTRLMVYGIIFQSMSVNQIPLFLLISTGSSAVLGVWVGSLFLQKITVKTIHYVIAFMLYILGILLVLGIV